ncbi:MAG: HK97 gp10 family phage protein [Selenomonadaceae bacterium]|nr:HK97 gp10 family phage protein [Selenomonadaceae bacterium]
MVKLRKQQVNIKKILQLYGDKAAQAARKALNENGENLAQTARELAPAEKGFYNGRHFNPKHPGRLRDSIHVEEGGKDKILVVADAKDDKGYCYAPIIEYSPRGKPFMKPAYEAKKIEMINHAKDVIRAAIKK